jgi:capsular polysaccharide biosynthesis protein
MNLIDYGRILLRRGWIVLLLAIIAGGGAYFYSKTQQPLYRSTQVVLIQPSRSDLSLTESSRSLLNQFSEYLDSTFIAQKVIDDLQLDMTPDNLKAAVEIASQPISISIEIAVKLPDGELANRVAKAWGEQLVQYRDAANQKLLRQDQVYAQLQDNPRYELYSPKPLIYAAAGGILGVLLGAILIFVLEYLESSVVRRREDLERVLEMPVLATIPDRESAGR